MTPAELHLKTTLRSITAAAIRLDQLLGTVVRDAVNAREALAKGHAVQGSALGHGPLGTQTPFDIAMVTAKLTALIDTALMLGATGDQITAAYKVTD